MFNSVRKRLHSSHSSEEPHIKRRHEALFPAPSSSAQNNEAHEFHIAEINELRKLLVLCLRIIRQPVPTLDFCTLIRMSFSLQVEGRRKGTGPGPSDIFNGRKL